MFGRVSRVFLMMFPLMLVSAAQAQNWPQKPVRIIIHQPPGGPSDSVPRGMQVHLAPKLGQAFVIENRPGAGGVVGLEACARAAPDGYTFCVSNNGGYSIAPLARTKLPFDTFRDFIPVVNFGTLESILIVHPSVPVSSAKELFDMVRAKPDTLTFSTIGHGSGGHLHMEWFRAKGMPMVHVPYKGGDAAMNAVVTGEVNVSLNGAGRVAPMVRAGKLKALAVDGDTPSEFIPNVLSLVQLGYDVNLRNWIGLFAPAATPRELVQRVNSEVNGLLADPQFVKQFLHSQGMVASGGTPEAFAGFLKKDRQMYEGLVRDAGVKFQE